MQELVYDFVRRRQAAPAKAEGQEVKPKSPMRKALTSLDDARESLRKARVELREMRAAGWTDEELEKCILVIGGVMDAMSELSLEELTRLEELDKGDRVAGRNYTQEMIMRQNKRLMK